MSQINTHLLIERRHALGLAQLTLARQARLSQRVLARLERGGDPSRVTLGELHALATAVGSNSAALLLTDRERSQAPAPDDIKLEAALATTRHRLTTKDLAKALSWTLGRTHAGLADLRNRLAGTGQRLVLNAGRWSLQPDSSVLSAAEIQRCERARITNDRISVTYARLLRDAMRGRLDGRWLQNASETQRMSLARLQRLGWLLADGGTFVITDAVRYGLPIDLQERVVEPRSRP